MLSQKYINEYINTYYVEAEQRMKEDMKLHCLKLAYEKNPCAETDEAWLTYSDTVCERRGYKS